MEIRNYLSEPLITQIKNHFNLRNQRNLWFRQKKKMLLKLIKKS